MGKHKKGILYQTGQTTDGKIVLAGLYKFYETHGLPLDVLFDCCMERNTIPDWIDLYQSARLAGMQHDRVLSKLEEAISDSYGKEWSDIVISRLDKEFKDR